MASNDEMSGLARVAAALTFGEPDRVPAAPLVCGASHRFSGISYADWSRCDNVEAMVQGHVDSIDFLGLDGVVALVDLTVEAGDFGCEVIYPEMDTAHPNYDDPFIKGPEDYKKIKKIDPRKSGRMKGIIDMVAGLSQEIGQSHAIVGFVYGSLGTLSMMRGPENFFMDLIEHPDEVKEALEIMDEVLLDYAVAQAEAGAHGVCYDNLYASQSIMGKDMWREFESDGMLKCCKAIQDTGALVVHHNCGNGIYFDELQEYGIPNAISHAYVADDVDSWEEHKEKWGGQIATIGWIPPGPVAMLGSPEEIEEECQAEIEIFKEGAGFILSTGCEFPPNAPLKHAKSIVEAAKKYGVY